MQSRTTTVLLFFLASLSFTLGTESEQHHNSRRAPSGFTGVRGKKSIPDSAYAYPEEDHRDSLNSINSINSINSLNQNPGDPQSPEEGAPPGDLDQGLVKRAPSGFMGMRGKKPYGAWEGTYPDKRAPSGFMGMRGKKEMEFSNFDEDYMKRAPSGFFGMRGKKEYDYLPAVYEGYSDKRAPMGFMGMRGKKDGLDDLSEDKRAPSGFFGMRGKKMPRQSGFFGMRGKKYPYEFRGKFVGVRGKKSNEVTGPDFYPGYPNNNAESGQDLDINQLMLLLTENNEKNWNNEGLTAPQFSQ